MVKRTVKLLGAALVIAGCLCPAGEPSCAVPAAGSSNDPPTFDVGISVDQAYAAIPHRRTPWVENDSKATAQEREYLRVIFQVVDQAIALRVAGQQNYASQRFEDPDIEGDYAQLINFVRSMPVPPALASYHRDLLSGLSNQHQFFANWKAQRDRFPFAQRVQDSPDVRKASAAIQAAYGQLMSRYPSDTPGNREAFYDYHCSLDFL